MDEVMRRGMQCLIDGLGVVEAERFISAVIQEQIDYTKWQWQYHNGSSDEEDQENFNKLLKE